MFSERESCAEVLALATIKHLNPRGFGATKRYDYQKVLIIGLAIGTLISSALLVVDTITAGIGWDRKCRA